MEICTVDGELLGSEPDGESDWASSVRRHLPRESQLGIIKSRGDFEIGGWLVQRRGSRSCNAKA